MSIATTIKNNPGLKKFVHRLLLPNGGARPRLWVRLILNRFYHQRGKGSKIRFNTRIDVLPFNKFILGRKAIIEDFATINNGVGDVIIGDNTLIGMGNVLIGPVTIGNNVIFAQNIVASGLNHGYQEPTVPIMNQPVSTAQIVVEDDCWIAANVVLTAGITIGKHTVVGAGSVVTKSIPPYSVVAGNPARVLKSFNAVTGRWERVSS